MKVTEGIKNLHLDAASNFSDFFFRFHFQGLNSLPRAENLLTVVAVLTGFLSKCKDDVLVVAEPKLLVRTAVPFCFLPKNKLSGLERRTTTIIEFYIF